VNKVVSQRKLWEVGCASLCDEIIAKRRQAIHLTMADINLRSDLVTNFVTHSDITDA